MDVRLYRRNGLGLAEIRPSKHHPVPGPIRPARNANHQIGRVYLFDLFPALAEGWSPFYSSASVFNFLLRLQDRMVPGMSHSRHKRHNPHQGDTYPRGAAV
jgi:hypothetical protein